jgi:hypothetical protein
MSPTLKEVAKFIADKLVIGLVVVAASFYGNFLLEEYEVRSSINVSDSNKLVKRLILSGQRPMKLKLRSVD